MLITFIDEIRIYKSILPFILQLAGWEDNIEKIKIEKKITTLNTLNVEMYMATLVTTPSLYASLPTLKLLSEFWFRLFNSFINITLLSSLHHVDKDYKDDNDDDNDDNKMIWSDFNLPFPCWLRYHEWMILGYYHLACSVECILSACKLACHYARF